MPHFEPNDYRNSADVRLRQNIVNTLLSVYGDDTPAAERLTADLWQFIQDNNEYIFQDNLESYAQTFVTTARIESVRGFIRHLSNSYDGFLNNSTRLTGLLLRQDVSDDVNASPNYFTDVSDILQNQVSNTDKFSRISEIETCRAQDGLFRFKLVYEDQDLQLTWCQRINPLFFQAGELDPDFVLIDIKGDHNNGVTFTGLRINEMFSQFGLLDGSVGNTFFWTVGAYQAWSGGAIGPQSTGFPSGIASGQGLGASRVYSLFSV